MNERLRQQAQRRLSDSPFCARNAIDDMDVMDEVDVCSSPLPPFSAALFHLN